MSPEQFEQFMNSQRALYKLYRDNLTINQEIWRCQLSIAKKLDRLIENQPFKEPDYQKSLAEYPNFDWSSINAKIVAKDADGVSSVEWNGRIYKRRAPENKFSPAIWFSRKDGDQYQKLITFKTIEPAEPISRKVLNTLSNSK